MTAPLYDVKARLSEYVTMAENGEVVEITKYGVGTTVIISKKEYERLNDEYEQNHMPSFMDLVNEWRMKTGGLSQEDADEFCNILEKQHEEERKYFDDDGENIWD